jgi:5-carboxymethyl-2-hydroxymuconate isomerase
MPHLIIEYSRNLEDDIEIKGLIDVVHSVARKSPLFEPAAIRTRALPVDNYKIADGDPSLSFIHLYVRIKPGRPPEKKMELAQAVHRAAKSFLQPVLDRRGLAFNVEVQDVADTSVRFRSYGDKPAGKTPDRAMKLPADASFVDFADDGSAVDTVRRTGGRGQNFLVEWLEFSGNGRAEIECDDEMFIVAAESELEISWQDGSTADLRPSTVAITPPGQGNLRGKKGGKAILIAPIRDDAAGDARNAGQYGERKAAVAPLAAPRRRKKAAGIVVIDADSIEPPADKPRLRMLRSASMSINWVRYEGPRDRRQLSPHSHADFEQGSLAVAGNFVHHLRVPWGSDSTHWQPDTHLEAHSPSLVVIPPGVEHTTEGVGDTGHLLIDVFAPARRDFIEKGWIANASDYE